MKICKFLFIGTVAASLSLVGASQSFAKGRSAGASSVRPKSATRPTPTIDQRLFEFKGVKPGDSAEQHADKWRTRDELTSEKCKPGSDGVLGCYFIDNLVSGVKVYPLAMFGDKGLIILRGDGPIEELEVLANAFKLKYGTPTKVDEVSYQNGFGARWSYNSYWWDFVNGSLTLHPERDPGSRSQLSARFVFMSKQFMDDAERKQNSSNIDF